MDGNKEWFIQESTKVLQRSHAEKVRLVAAERSSVPSTNCSLFFDFKSIVMPPRPKNDISHLWEVMTHVLHQDSH